METASAVRTAIVSALADIAQLRSRRFGSRNPIAEPKFKKLVLQVYPNAAVRRVGSWEGRQASSATYQGFIGAVRICCRRCTGSHRTPNGAWICFARYIADSEELQ
jgi:hypothetical protein